MAAGSMVSRRPGKKSKPQPNKKPRMCEDVCIGEADTKRPPEVGASGGEKDVNQQENRDSQLAITLCASLTMLASP